MQLHTIMSSWKAIHSKDRLTHPLIRRNGKLEKASWDEAMDLVVQKSKELLSRLTAHSIAFYTTGQLFLEEYYALALIGKAGLQTLHMYASCFLISRPPPEQR
jgi:ferredoxin-nitrate reductase